MIYAQFAEKTFLLFLMTIIIPNILPLMLGFFIFIKPEKITNKIINGTKETTEKDKEISLEKIERICLSTLGFYVLFQASSDLVFNVANFIQAVNSSSYPAQFSYSLIFTPSFIATIAECLFAFWLIFKTKGILKIVNNFRTAGNKA